MVLTHFLSLNTAAGIASACKSSELLLLVDMESTLLRTASASETPDDLLFVVAGDIGVPMRSMMCCESGSTIEVGEPAVLEDSASRYEFTDV